MKENKVNNIRKYISGFTLIHWVVMVVVIGLLSAMATPWLAFEQVAPYVGMAMAGQLVTDIIGYSQRDIGDLVVKVDMKKTPIFSMLPKGSQQFKDMIMKRPVDRNLEPEHNAVPDAQDVTDFENPLADYAQVTGYMQHFRPKKGWKIGKQALEAQNLPGYKQKKAEMVVKKMIQLKRMIECSIGSDLDTKAPAAGVGSVSRGLGSWIKETAQTVEPVPAAYLTASGCVNTTATTSLVESSVQDILQASYEENGEEEDWTFFAGPNHKKIYRGFMQAAAAANVAQASTRTFQQDGASDKITASVSYFEGDFGSLTLVKSLFLAYWDATTPTNTVVTTPAQKAISKARCYGLKMNRWEWNGRQAPQSEEYPNLGGGPSGNCDAIGGLMCLNPRDQLKFAPTS